MSPQDFVQELQSPCVPHLNLGKVRRNLPNLAVEIHKLLDSITTVQEVVTSGARE
jgi:hypothetical protein